MTGGAYFSSVFLFAMLHPLASAYSLRLSLHMHVVVTLLQVLAAVLADRQPCLDFYSVVLLFLSPTSCFSRSPALRAGLA